VTAALAEAKAVLSGDLVVPIHSVRAAAWLARSALEESLGALVRAKGLDPGQASTRTLLSCVEVLYENVPGLATSAQYAWDTLSRAAHHHAYELAPTYSEVEAAMSLVGVVAAQAGLGARAKAMDPL